MGMHCIPHPEQGVLDVCLLSSSPMGEGSRFFTLVLKNYQRLKLKTWRIPSVRASCDVKRRWGR